MSSEINRRTFMAKSAAAGAGFMIAKSGILAAGKSPNSKLNIAIIGCGGRGRMNTSNVSSENIVALCDVNEEDLAAAVQLYPNAKTYFDWRKCLEQKDVDAILCSTVDHTHAHIANWAMNRDLHVYMEKPLGNSVEEARVVRETFLKKKGKVATQMGIQRHAIDNMARVVELVKMGAIGTPQDARMWTAREPEMRNYYPSDGPPPSHIHWDLWLGPAPERPFSKAYVTPRDLYFLGKEGKTMGSRCLTWNIFWDFGSGQVGDMCSHTMDIAAWALDLGLPSKVICHEGPDIHPDSVPNYIVVEWEHPANDWRPAVRTFWYHGGKFPGMPSKAFNPEELKVFGALGDAGIIKGDQGSLVCSYNNRYLMPLARADMTHYKSPKPEDLIPPVRNHYREWVDACKTDKQTRCDFDYSGKLIESNMLALVAYRFKGQSLEYDAKQMKIPNLPEAEQYLRKTYRPGWPLNG